MHEHGFLSSLGTRNRAAWARGPRLRSSGGAGLFVWFSQAETLASSPGRRTDLGVTIAPRSNGPPIGRPSQQKASNENASGLIRKFFPEGAEFDCTPGRRRAGQRAPSTADPKRRRGWRTLAEAAAKVPMGVHSAQPGATIARLRRLPRQGRATPMCYPWRRKHVAVMRAT